MGRLAATCAVLATLAALLFGACRQEPHREAIRVYAAASLADVMEAVTDTFRTLPDGGEVLVNVAGTSLLARQIDRGARADVFLSAHPSWTDFLVERGRIHSPTMLPISNRLVEVHRTGGSRSSPHARRMALADPSHVPAGIYARQALECEGRWREIEDDIVPTLDVRAALTAVQAGAVSSAIVYSSDALLAPELETRDAVSDRCQPDIRYTAGVVRGSGRRERAVRFLELMCDPAVEPLWRRFGFSYLEDR